MSDKIRSGDRVRFTRPGFPPLEGNCRARSHIDGLAYVKWDGVDDRGEATVHVEHLERVRPTLPAGWTFHTAESVEYLEVPPSGWLSPPTVARIIAEGPQALEAIGWNDEEASGE